MLIPRSPMIETSSCKFERSPSKKRKEEEEEEEPSWYPLSTLPEDIALSCLARVSRRKLATLPILSKRYRYLLACPDLYKSRSLIGFTETYLYVCIRTPPPNLNPSWYILRRDDDAFFSVLIPIPSLSCQSPEGSSVVALDWGIYVIGGLSKGSSSSDVWLLDCRTHTWRRLPSMRVPRSFAAAAVVDGKIYVLGGCSLDEKKNKGEVFDPKTETWDSLLPMPAALEQQGRAKYIIDCVVKDGKIFAVDGMYRTLYYSPMESKWGTGSREQLVGSLRDWCLVGGLLYSCRKDGRICWSKKEGLDWRDSEQHEDGTMHLWKEVDGLESLYEKLSASRLVHCGQHVLPELAVLLPGFRLINFGENLLVFWDQIGWGSLQIWCAEISLHRQLSPLTVWGNIKWSNLVLNYPLRLDPDRYKRKSLR